MTMKATAPFLALFLLAATTASAQVQMSTVSIPSTVANPISSGFTISYTMLGSKVGLASAQVTFYLATSPTATTGYQLDSFQIPLYLNQYGNFSPLNTTYTRYISASGLPSGTYSVWQSIISACQPSTWYVLGRVDSTSLVSSLASQMGTTKQPDFYFTAGTISPTTIQSGGTTNISFSVYTQCPASSASTVGIYLADSSYNLLAYIGGVSVPAGAGTSSLPPTGITFSSIAPGNYNIVLFADDAEVVAESNEANNAGAFNLTVTSPLTARASEAGEADEQKLNTELPAELSPALYDPRMRGAVGHMSQTQF